MALIFMSFIFLLWIPCAILGQLTVNDISNHDWMQLWTVRLVLNLIGYATIFVPGALIIQYLRRVKYVEGTSKYFFVDYFC